MRSRLAMVFLCIAMLLASCTAARAQSATGQFNGHVTDQNGAVVPGATVTLQDVGTSLNRNTQTNGEGLYQFPLVQPGVYKISVTQTGFETATSAELKLDVNQISKPGLQTGGRCNLPDGHGYVCCRITPSLDRQPGRCGRNAAGG